MLSRAGGYAPAGPRWWEPRRLWYNAVLAAAIGWLRRPHRERDPALADGYRSIGGLTLERFLELHSGNPWGRAFVTSLFAV